MSRGRTCRLRLATAAVLAGAVMACDPADRAAAEAAEPAGNRATDACELLTKADVEQVVGRIVSEPRLRGDAGGSTRCVWEEELGPPIAVLFVAHEVAAGPGAQAGEPSAEPSDGSVSEPVEGLGDVALWTPGLGDLQVWAYGQKLQLGNPGIELTEARELAERALERMR